MAKFVKSRLQIYQRDTISESEIPSTLGEMIFKLMELKKKHGEDANFSLDVDSGYYNAYAEIEVSSHRDETQEEYDERYRVHLELERQKRSTAKQKRLDREERDRVEFERLKKKFKSK